MKNLFLLGGRDLEMETIKSVLIENHQEFLDSGLPWGQASLSKYISQIDGYSAEEYTIFGIELTTDGVRVPLNYVEVDHHNNNQDKTSALEQVCDILGLKMSRKQALIAANDSEYIPGMIKAGATQKEIEEIRLLDRQCQGITESDEQEAVRAIAESTVKNALRCVSTSTSHFSAIIDRLFPCNSVLVYTNTEMAYYGRDKEPFLDAVTNEFKGLEFYKGGKIAGYFGISNCKKEIINKIITFIMKQNIIISKHIFLFPFTWESKDGSEDLRKSFKSITGKSDSNWERVILTDVDNEKPDIYNERNYFYPFTHDTVYDLGGDSNIRHFERKEPKSGNVKYVIETNDKTYALPVEKIHLNFYSSGVGVLSIFTKNLDYSDDVDILKINQFGRRLFPPFFADANFHRETARGLSIEGLDSVFRKDFFAGAQMLPNTQASFIDKLICEAADAVYEIKPILDDRMFVLAWYKYVTVDFRKDKEYQKFISDQENAFLYKYIFIDAGDATCQTKEMYDKLLKDAVYDRWQRQGTLYGVSRYSFVMLTTSSCPDYLLRYFETEYERMAEMVLVQRASIIRFSNALKASTNSGYKHFSRNYAEYINFLSKYRFPEISAQDQATELYDSLCAKIRIKENAEHLDNQFNEIQEFLELNNQRHLNVWAAILVPVSLLSAGYTFFYHDDFALNEDGTLSFLMNSGPVWFILSVIAAIAFGILFGRKNR